MILEMWLMKKQWIILCVFYDTKLICTFLQQNAIYSVCLRTQCVSSREKNANLARPTAIPVNELWFKLVKGRQYCVADNRQKMCFPGGRLCSEQSCIRLTAEPLACTLARKASAGAP